MLISGEKLLMSAELRECHVIHIFVGSSDKNWSGTLPWKRINHLSINPAKWLNTLKHCHADKLSLFDYFVELTLNGLIYLFHHFKSMFTKKIIWKDLVSGGVPKNAFYQNRIWWMSDKMTCFLFMSTINCFIADGWVIEKKDTHSFLRKRFLRCINWLSCFNAILIITLPIRTNAVILCIIKIFTRKGPWVKNGAFSKHSKYLTQWAVIFRF